MAEERETEEVETDEENGLTLDDDESKELQEVFSTVFPQYLVPLEELVGQLLDGKSSPEIVEGLRGAVAPLVSAASSVGVEDLGALLVEFQKVIDEVGERDQLDEQAQNKVIDVFYRLKEAVQEIGGSPSSEETGPSDFVKTLSSVEGLDADGVQKVLAAGISSAEHVVGASVDEIAAVTGLDEETAHRIQRAFGGGNKKKNRGGSGEPQRGGGATGTPRESSNRSGLKISDLRSRVALVGVVRERIRLEEVLEREQQKARRVEQRAEELSRAVIVLRTRLLQHKEELALEQELTASRQKALERLRGEVDRAQTAAPLDALPELQERLEKLKAQIATRKSRTDASH